VVCAGGGERRWRGSMRGRRKKEMEGVVWEKEEGDEG